MMKIEMIFLVSSDRSSEQKCAISKILKGYHDKIKPPPIINNTINVTIIVNPQTILSKVESSPNV